MRRATSTYASFFTSRAYCCSLPAACFPLLQSPSGGGAMNRFAGKVVLVTGAGSERGIGRATALAFAKAGAKVAIMDVDAAGVERVARELNEHTQAMGEVADV